MSVFHIDHVNPTVGRLTEPGMFLYKNGQMPMFLTYDQASELVDLLYAALPKQSRIDIIGQNGNDGQHYNEE